MLWTFSFSERELSERERRIEALIFGMARGEVSAMGELYELIGRDVYAYALSKTAALSDAEDVTHDTFVQVWRTAKQYRPMGKPLAWIFTVELNIIRRQGRIASRTVSIEDAPEPVSEDGELPERLVNDILLREMLHRLSEREREIVTLHAISGLKHREIAELLHCPLSTVLSKYNRAIRKLRDILTEEGSK